MITPTNRTALPIRAHQLAGPFRLEHRSPGRELDHERLHVEHRRSVDGVEAADAQLEAADVDQLTAADADAVGTTFGPLGQDAHLRPVGIPTRTAGTAHDGILPHQMEEVHDLDVGEVLEAQRRVLVEQRAVEDDRRLYVPPVVVDRVLTPPDHAADGLDVEPHSLYASSTLTTPVSPSTSSNAPSGMLRVAPVTLTTA